VVAAMSNQLAGLIICLAVAALLFAVAILIRIRGPRGLVNGVDWSSVSDAEGLGQFVSLMLSVIGALSAGFGVVLYALGANRQWINIAGVIFTVLVLVVAFAVVVGVSRYQDRPPTARKHDGRR
jgi:hypothetical protein